ncbi:hypothetical protein [Pectobacterium versatile]|uniref:hypothetical protein n=1 Tax=Pectobacterium versatile TaxID=2488639 RepID=UPI003814B1A5
MSTTNKHLENLKEAVRKSLIKKIANNDAEIIDLDVIRCAGKFINSNFNKEDILFFVISTVIEMEGLRLSLESSVNFKDSFDKLMTSVREAEKAEDNFSKQAIDSIYTLGDFVSELRGQLDQKSTEMARSGGKGRQKKYEPLVQRTIELYDTKNWQSARQAARSIESEIIEMGKSIGVPLTGEQPWETIQKWILKYSKK